MALTTSASRDLDFEHMTPAQCELLGQFIRRGITYIHPEMRLFMLSVNDMDDSYVDMLLDMCKAAEPMYIWRRGTNPVYGNVILAAGKLSMLIAKYTYHARNKNMLRHVSHDAVDAFIRGLEMWRSEPLNCSEGVMLRIRFLMRLSNATTPRAMQQIHEFTNRLNNGLKSDHAVLRPDYTDRRVRTLY